MDKLESIRDQIGEIKIDVREIKSDVSEIKTTMAVNTASLEYHVARTNELQEIVTNFSTELLKINQNVADMDARYKKNMAMVNGAAKILAVLGAILVFLKEIGLIERLFGL